MIIDLSKIEELAHPNFKGGEKDYHSRMFSDDRVKIMKGRLTPGASIGQHTHTTDMEVILLTKGIATVNYDGQTFQLRVGECHYCPKGHSHCLKNDTDSDIEFTAIVAQQ